MHTIRGYVVDYTDAVIAEVVSGKTVKANKGSKINDLVNEAVQSAMADAAKNIPVDKIEDNIAKKVAGRMAA